MSDTSAGTFNAAMTVVNMALMKYVPGLAIAVKIPFVGGLISGIGAGISNHLRDMFGAFPDPPPLPVGYHYGTFPIVTDTYVTLNLEEYINVKGLPEDWEPDPEVNSSSTFHVWFNGVIVVGEDIVLRDEDDVPVSDYNHKKGTLKQALGYTKDGVMVVGSSVASLSAIGRISTGFTTGRGGVSTPNYWKATKARHLTPPRAENGMTTGTYVISSSSARASAKEKAEEIAPIINAVPNVWPVALAIIIIVSLIIWKVKK